MDDKPEDIRTGDTKTADIKRKEKKDMRIEKGTPGFGILIGLILAGMGALVMWIGFWRALILIALFGVGYFLGSVDNKEAFLKETANRIIPAKDDKPIDIKQEIAREQQEQFTASEPETPETKEE